MDDISFYLYIFNSQLRKDGIDEDFVLVTPIHNGTRDIAGYHIPSGMSVRMIYLASYVYSYNINNEKYTVIKSRTGANGVDIKSTFSNLTPNKTVYIMNQDIGNIVPLDHYLINSRVHSTNQNNKIIEFSLDGLEEPDIYLSALFDQG